MQRVVTVLGVEADFDVVVAAVVTVEDALYLAAALSYFGDIGNLTLEDEGLALLNLGHPEFVHCLDGERMPDTGLQFSFDFFKNRLELLKVLAQGTIA